MRSKFPILQKKIVKFTFLRKDDQLAPSLKYFIIKMAFVGGRG